MPRIRCTYEGCIHLEGTFCTAGEIELDQELGCLTFSQVDEEIIGIDEDLEEAAVAVVTTAKEWDEEDFEEDEDEDLEEWEDDEDEEDDDDEEEDGWSAARSRRR